MMTNQGIGNLNAVLNKFITCIYIGTGHKKLFFKKGLLNFNK